MKSELYKNDLWAQLGEQIMKISADDIETSARSVLRAQARQLKILLGCLHTDENSSIHITFQDGQWLLATVTKVMGGISYEEMCRHEDWLKFIELCAEYSDYVEGEDE